MKRRGPELVFQPDLVHDYWRKILLILYSIKWPYFIAWLHLLLEILDIIYIVTIWYPARDNITVDWKSQFWFHFFTALGSINMKLGHILVQLVTNTSFPDIKCFDDKMKKSEFSIYMPIFLINWDSLSLNSHYESWSYKKKN